MMWDTIAEENCDTAMDCLSFQTKSTTAAGAAKSARRLNMDESFHQMACDDDQLTFYDDATALMQREKDELSFAALDDGDDMLLPDEGSPMRFRIVSNKPTKPDTVASAAPAFIGSLTQSNLNARQQTPRNGMGVESSNLGVGHNNHHQTPKGFRVFHSLSSESMESSMDDEYMELFEMESMDAQPSLCNEFKFPSNLNSLFSGKIQSSTISPASENSVSQHAQLTKTPEMRRPSVRRCLSMTENQYQQKTPEYLEKCSSRLMSERMNLTPNTNQCFKRPDPPSLTCSPIQTKRYRQQEKENLDSSFIALESSVPVTTSHGNVAIKATNEQLVTKHGKSCNAILRKSMSMNDADIMSALARSENKDEPVLIGDFSKPFVLPLLEGRHRDLKSVSSDTVARLINGEFAEQVATYKIIDCRYPYEFEGGHIRGAKNLYTQEQIVEEFLTQQKTEEQKNLTSLAAANGNKRNIIIFHCEFSSERGPKLSRFLRNNDRARNTNAYPALDYPEIYLLHNGYKEFFETHAELCDPIAYRPMLEPSYNEAYRHFRAKSKSWNGDGLGGGTTRLKKSRSRLLL